MARDPSNRRRGSATVYALIALVLLLLVGLFVVNAAWMTGARTQLDGGADAAALAAASAFVDDAALRGDNEEILGLILDADAEARRLALLNPVLGDPLKLKANPTNDRDGDIVVGYVEQFRGPFIPADLKKKDEKTLPFINAVRIRGRRLGERGNPIRLLGGFPGPLRTRDADTQATAVLDGAVIGFRQVFAGVPIPLAPLALRSDISAEDSWEQQVIGGEGPDEWTYDKASRRLVKRSDQLHEMSARLVRPKEDKDGDKEKDKGGGTEKDKDGDKEKDKGGDKEKEKKDERSNVFLLTLGEGSAPLLSRQVVDGLTRSDLAEHGGEFVLESDGELIVSGTRWAPKNDELRNALRDALRELERRGEARAWPLFDEDNGSRARIMGFVAARVADVRDDGKGGLMFELQPTRLATPTAVTARDRQRRSSPPGIVPYVVKLRLVD